MTTPLSERDQQRWEATQSVDIDRRRDFMMLNKETQKTIVTVLSKADRIAHKKSVPDAQTYIQRTISVHMDKHHRFTMGDDGIDWNEVYEQIIKSSLFSDDDMEGLRLMARKLAPEVTVLRSLMEIEPPIEWYF